MPNNLGIKAPKALSLLAVLVLALILACGSNGDTDGSRDDIALVWEAWEKIDGAIVNREALETDAVTGGALRRMAALVDGPSYPFLTEVGRVRGQVPPEVPVALADVWRGLLVHQRRWPDVELKDLVAAAIRGLWMGWETPRSGSWMRMSTLGLKTRLKKA